jgi:hypothetical protein
MQVKFRFWKSGFSVWQDMFQDAANFASKLPKDRLINISHSGDEGTGVVVVWYWAENESAGQ